MTGARSTTLEEGPTKRRLAAGRRIADLMLDADYRRKLCHSEDGEVSFIVGDWSDRMGDIYDHVRDFGLPATLLMPAGDGFLRFHISEDEAVGANRGDESRPYNPRSPLAKFLLEVMIAGSISLDLDAPVSEVIHSIEKRKGKKMTPPHQIVFQFELSEAA